MREPDPIARLSETKWADGRNWLAFVGGRALVGRDGNPRRFRTQEAAQEAADLDAFLRDC